jgi:cysteine desulfurase family protein
MIYFDNAATTLHKPPEVVRAVACAIETFGNIGRGAHEPALAAARAVHEARKQLARLFGAPSAARVSFMANATEALNIAIDSLFVPGSHAVTTAASHNSVLRPLYRRRKQGGELSVVPIAPDASMDYRAFASLFRENTSLAVVTHASNLTGDVYDIERMADICHAHGATFVVDAAQTAGIIPIDMQKMGVDVLVFTGHKSLFGPQGTGGLCVNDGIELAPYLVGGSGIRSYDEEHPTAMPESLEAGTLNSHGIAGLSAGLAYIEGRGIPVIAERIQALTCRFEEGLRGGRGITIYGGHAGIDRCGIVALNLDGRGSAEISELLAVDHGIATRSGAHCAPLMHRALGTVEQGVVRFSFSHFNTTAEIDSGIEALRMIARSGGLSGGRVSGGRGC